MVIFQENAGITPGEEEDVCRTHEGGELLGATGEGGGVFCQEEGGFPEEGGAIQGGRRGGEREGGRRRLEAAFEGGEALEDGFEVGEEEDGVFAE
jgi:hypothetical protein